MCFHGHLDFLGIAFFEEYLKYRLNPVINEPKTQTSLIGGTSLTTKLPSNERQRGAGPDAQHSSHTSS